MAGASPPRLDLSKLGVPLRGIMMTEREVSYVLHIHMRSLQITDPFSEDYYYHQYHVRRAAQAASPARVAQLPLPIWEDSKAIARKEHEELQNKFAGRTKQWELEYKVLGHQQKVNPHRQKPLLDVDSAPTPVNAAADDGSASADVDGNKPQTFVSWEWQARAAVESAKSALLEVDEQRRLLQHPDLSAHRMTVINAQLQRILAKLQTSLGLSEAQNYDVVDNAPLLAAVADLGKGRKLLARVFKLLPQKAHAMLPTVLRSVLRSTPVGDADVNVAKGETKRLLLERLATERSLLAALADVAQSPEAAVPFSTLQSCVQAVMSAHVRTSTLGAALATPQRAEVMDQLIARATTLVEPEHKEDWGVLVDGFRHLATLRPAA